MILLTYKSERFDSKITAIWGISLSKYQALKAYMLQIRT